jgi:hypothetical protein
VTVGKNVTCSRFSEPVALWYSDGSSRPVWLVGLRRTSSVWVEQTGFRWQSEALKWA